MKIRIKWIFYIYTNNTKELGEIRQIDSYFLSHVSSQKEMSAMLYHYLTIICLQSPTLVQNVTPLKSVQIPNRTKLPIECWLILNIVCHIFSHSLSMSRHVHFVITLTYEPICHKGPMTYFYNCMFIQRLKWNVFISKCSINPYRSIFLRS